MENPTRRRRRESDQEEERKDPSPGLGVVDSSFCFVVRRMQMISPLNRYNEGFFFVGEIRVSPLPISTYTVYIYCMYSMYSSPSIGLGGKGLNSAFPVRFLGLIAFPTSRVHEACRKKSLHCWYGHIHPAKKESLLPTTIIHFFSLPYQEIMWVRLRRTMFSIQYPKIIHFSMCEKSAESRFIFTYHFLLSASISSATTEAAADPPLPLCKRPRKANQGDQMTKSSFLRSN